MSAGMSKKSERIQILEMIESGVITSDEGARLLLALERASTRESDYGNRIEQSALPEPGPEKTPGESEPVIEEPETLSGFSKKEFDAHIERWRRWWMIPLWIGTGVTVLGGLLMLWAFQAGGFSFWFACSWLPFLLGLGIIILAWGTRTARWMHIRVQQRPGERPQNIALSFPLPIKLAAWFFRTFGQRLPSLNKTGLDELLLALGNSASHETPFYVEVDEGEDGERVQIYIG